MYATESLWWNHKERVLSMSVGGLNLAANLACMMNETPGLDKVFRMAIEAYDHVPMK